MSLWYCPNCKGLFGNVYTCPTCQTPTEFATIQPGTDPPASKIVNIPMSSQTSHSVTWDPKCLENLCWCTNLHAVGLPRNQKCEPCTRRDHAELIDAVRDWIEEGLIVPDERLKELVGLK